MPNGHHLCVTGAQICHVKNGEVDILLISTVAAPHIHVPLSWFLSRCVSPGPICLSHVGKSKPITGQISSGAIMHPEWVPSISLLIEGIGWSMQSCGSMQSSHPAPSTQGGG